MFQHEFIGSKYKFSPFLLGQYFVNVARFARFTTLHLAYPKLVGITCRYLPIRIPFDSSLAWTWAWCWTMRSCIFVLIATSIRWGRSWTDPRWAMNHQTWRTSTERPPAFREAAARDGMSDHGSSTRQVTFDWTSPEAGTVQAQRWGQNAGPHIMFTAQTDWK